LRGKSLAKQVRVNVYYAGIVESGVKKGKNKFAGRFYMKRAADSTRTTMYRILRDESLGLIERIAKNGIPTINRTP
jgi:hypothetical protein